MRTSSAPLTCIEKTHLNPNTLTVDPRKWHPKSTSVLFIYDQYFTLYRCRVDRKTEYTAYRMIQEGRYIKKQPGKAVSDNKKNWQYRLLAVFGIDKARVTAAIVRARLTGGNP